MLADLLRCTDNEYMHENCQRWVFMELHAIKISPWLPLPLELPWWQQHCM